MYLLTVAQVPHLKKGYIYLGFGRGASPRFLHANLLWLSIWTVHTFVGVDDVIERITEVSLGPCRSLHLVRFPNELIIGAAAKHPSQRCPTSKDRA